MRRLLLLSLHVFCRLRQAKPAPAGRASWTARKLPVLLALLAPLALAAPGPVGSRGGPGGQISAAAAYKQGQYRMAARALTPQLRRYPNDPNANAMMGVSRARLGQYGEALPHFSSAAGASLYETDGLGAHAESLRAVGRGREAAALRLQRRVVARPDQEMMILLNGVDDLRAAGALDAAWDLVWEALSLRPNSPVARCHLAELLMDLGDLEGAGFQLWRASNQPSLRLKLARARLAILEGDPARAEQLLQPAPGERLRSWRTLALLSEIALARGDADEALYRLSRPAWSGADHPELLALRARALAAAGDATAADAARFQAIALYPDHPAVRALSSD